MPSSHAPGNEEKNYIAVFNKALEGAAECSSSIESSFDSESHGAKDCTSSDSSQKHGQTCIGSDDMPVLDSHSKDDRSKHVYIAEEVEDDTIVETTFLRRDSDKSTSVLSDNYLTMSGTIKRGKKKGQNVDVILNMSREELEVLEAAMVDEKPTGLTCGFRGGPHIVLLSLLCVPFTFVASAFYSFCIGTLTWYNIFTYFSEEKPLIYRIFLTPLLILFYPFLIVLLSLGLGLAAGATQVSWYWTTWCTCISDLEKGFYGWLCNALHLPDCSPYEVVILSGIQKTEA